MPKKTERTYTLMLTCGNCDAANVIYVPFGIGFEKSTTGLLGEGASSGYRVDGHFKRVDCSNCGMAALS